MDKLRPKDVSFQTIMQKRIDYIQNPALRPKEKNVKGNEALVTADPPVFNEQRELKQVGALDTLLEDKYANRFPMPQVLRNPQTNPSHYDDLVKELHEAPNRGWVSNFIKRIKGGLRFK